jgi:hypothetical protein
MADYIDNDVRKNMGKKTLEDVSSVYAKLGLLPRGVDLRTTLLSFYSSQTLAFYDSKAKKVVLREALMAARIPQFWERPTRES